jgi:hypothetical protein
MPFHTTPIIIITALVCWLIVLIIAALRDKGE